jgi:CelD/BcsL family acetyltransferase involved in cellulose biosynthesis
VGATAFFRPALSHARERGELEVEVLDDWDGLGAEWDALAAASGNVFATREWVSCWWRHLGAGRTRAALVVRSADEGAVAVVPLYVWARRPLTVLRFAGHRGAGTVTPACRPEDAERVGAAIRAALPQLGCDVLLADALPTDPAWAEHLAGRVVNVLPSPTLALRASWEDQRRGFSSNLRQELGRKERRLERERGLGYRLVTGPDEAGPAFETLLELHGSRWDGATTFADPAFREFQRAFAQAAARAGWLRLWLLELGGAPVAAWYGLRFGGSETYYQAGRDPDAGPESIGTVLLARTIRAAVEDGGVSEYRFGPGGSPYKYRFADRRDVLHVATVGRGIAARAAVGVVARARALAPVRALVRQAARRS